MIYINRDEYEDDKENKEKKNKIQRTQKEKLPLFNIINYDDLKKEYDSYSIPKKLELQFAKRNVLNFELNTIEGIHKSRKMDELEEKVLRYQKNWLLKKVWLCEKEINDLFNYLPDNPYKAKVYKKIKDENVNDWSSGVPLIKINMTDKEIHSLSPQEKIKAIITYCNLFYLEFQALDKRKNESLKSRKNNEYEQLYLKLKCRWNKDTNEWYTDEKDVIDYDELRRLYREELPDDYLFLEHRIDYMKRLIYSYKIQADKIYHKELPKNYPYRKEILEEIQMIGVKVVEVLNLGSRFLPVGYLNKEKTDARNEKYMPLFVSGKGQSVFNYEILNKGFRTYSPKKKIDVGLANHYVLTLQINAIQKWRVSRKMNEFEEVISENRYNDLQLDLCSWDLRILNVYYVQKKLAKCEKIFTEMIESDYYKNTLSKIYDLKTHDSEHYREILLEMRNQKILGDKYYEKLLSEAPYSEEVMNEIHKKIENSNIDEESYKSETTDKPPKILMRLEELSKLCENSTLEYNELSPQNKIKYLIVRRNLFSAECDMILKNRGKLNEYEKIVFDSKCAYLSSLVVQIDDSIHHIFNEDIPGEYRKEIFEEMKNAKISDNSNLFHFRTNFDMEHNEYLEE
ncbi:hypothetical protein [Methanosarcina mazei]|uniref:Uncharacterized protein n=1 Tax=Methanosarcina mazei TaxID=2209 RepID=A0A0F8K5F7_METMZ|nr:hypothetical protein [Methanosarcina mazei]KKG83073.1 hypothetical protein DU55_08215 [Methanosarcina mazei]